jgi:hypothetical protein
MVDVWLTKSCEGGKEASTSDLMVDVFSGLQSCVEKKTGSRCPAAKFFSVIYHLCISGSLFAFWTGNLP